MTEPTSPPADSGTVEPTAPRNWKKIALYGAGGLGVVGVGIGVAVLASVLSRPAKPPAAAPRHEVSIATPPAQAQHRPAPAPAKIEPEVSEDDKELLQAEVLQLKAQKERLQREQAELQRQKENMILRQQGLTGEKQCKLSGDPVRRKEELRACFGLSSLVTLPAEQAASQPVGMAHMPASAATASPAAGRQVKQPASTFPATATSTPSPKPAPAGTLQSLQGHLDQLKIPALKTRQTESSKTPAKTAVGSPHDEHGDH